MSALKFNRAKKLSNTGQYNQTFLKLWHKLPTELIDNLTAKQIASVIDLMREQFLLGTNFEDESK